MAHVRVINIQDIRSHPWKPILVAPNHTMSVNQGANPVEICLKGDLATDGTPAVVLNREETCIYDRNATPRFRGIGMHHVTYANEIRLVFHLSGISSAFEGQESSPGPGCGPPWGLRGKFKPVLVTDDRHEAVEEIDLEFYGVNIKQLPTFFDSGIPLLLLRMFLPSFPTDRGRSDEHAEQSWIEHVTCIVHGSRKPFTGGDADTAEHWLKYNTYSGGASFAGTYGESGLRLTAWLDAWRNWDQHKYITTVNCYDQAAATEVALTLGISYEKIAWEYHQVFGFIQDHAELVGWGRCNNPYFDYDTSAIVLKSEDPRRQPFRNHALLSWSSRPITDDFIEKWNEVMDEVVFYEEYLRAADKLDGEAGLNMKMIDACAGPHTGSGSRRRYESAKEVVELPYSKHWSNEVKRSFGEDSYRWHEKHHLGRGITKDNTGSTQHLLPKYVADKFEKQKQNLMKILANQSEDNDIQTGSWQGLTKAFMSAIEKARPTWKLDPIPVRPYDLAETLVGELKLKYSRNDLTKGEAYVSMRVAVSKTAAVAKKQLIDHLAFRSLTSTDKVMKLFDERPEACIIGCGTIRSILVRNVSVDIIGREIWEDEKDHKVASEMLLWLALCKPSQDPAKWRDLLN